MEPWHTPTAISFLLEEIYCLLREWLETMSQATSTNYERDTFPVRLVDDAISKYIVVLASGTSPQLMINFQTLQRHLRHAF